MTAREARLFARLVEDAVGSGGDLPPVRDTDAVAAFDAWLRAAPRRNALAVRLLLRVDGRLAPARDVLRRLALHCYYGDPAVSRRLGYDAAAVVERAAAVRAAEGRP